MLKVINVDFYAKESGDRKANILCTSTEDGVMFLRKITKNKIERLNGIGMDIDVHGVSDDAIEYINKNSDKNILNDDSTEKKYFCPWCEKPFPTPMGLKVHIQKMHKKEEN